MFWWDGVLGRHWSADNPPRLPGIDSAAVARRDLSEVYYICCMIWCHSWTDALLRVSCDVHTTLTVTGALLLQGRGSGTPCRLNCNNVILSCNLSGV